uniref:Serpentine receptor class gamma n=1 Tax=Ditylenchus dipsaci TaxID=166011 RepID=A0A915DXP4_9BILA
MGKFKSSFYIIFTINGVTSNIWVIIGFIKNRASVAPTLFGLCRPLPTAGPLITLWFFLNYMLLIPCRLGDFLLTLNRFTIFYVAPRKQEKMWRYLLPISLTLAYIVAIGLNVPILVNGAGFRSPTALTTSTS